MVREKKKKFGAYFSVLSKNCFALILLAIPSMVANAQQNNTTFYFEASGGYISPGKMPFWLRSNRFGSVPVDNGSLSLTGSIKKEYDSVNGRIFDWGGAVDARINIGQNSNFSLIEGYGKIRISVLEIKMGRSREIMGLCDSTLSSGSFSVSGNAFGIPKIEIGFPRFVSLPVFKKLFAIKATYSHGWIGETTTSYNGNANTVMTYLHQLSLYGRIGKPYSKLKLYCGFNHQAFWGNEKSIFGNDFTLSVFQTYLYVITGKEYSTNTIEASRIGNHLGSVDLGFEYEFKNVRLFLYRQNFYDYTALKYLANLRDGLNGICLINKHNTGNLFQFKKVLFEFLYTKDQGVNLAFSDPTYVNEDYYNNYIYPDGWSYKGIGIGSPFITSKTYMREGLPANDYEYFVNNRVIAFHFGMGGSIQKWNYLYKSSFSINYGTYNTPGSFPETKQFSAYLETNRVIKDGLNLGFAGAFDIGGLYYDSFGILVKLAKTF